MLDTASTRKEAIWLSCKQKTCCYASFVLPSGRDVWRISRALDTPPSTFLVYFQTPKPRPDAFILDRSGRYFRVALAKQASRRKKSPPPCIFLLKTRNGHHRCGLGDLRPQVCHTFPMDIVAGVLCVPNDTGCTCRDWSLADVDIAEERAQVEVRQQGFQEYCSVVAEWNRNVANAPQDVAYSFFDFCDFMLAAYDELEAAQAAPVAEAAEVAR